MIDIHWNRSIYRKERALAQVEGSEVMGRGENQMAVGSHWRGLSAVFLVVVLRPESPGEGRVRR